MNDNEGAEDTLLTLTADIVAAHVSNNSVAVNDLPNLIQNVHGALTGIASKGGAVEPKPEPKVSIRASVKPDYVVCLEDGKKQKMLKRHLMTNHGMTPDEYRQKWGSPSRSVSAPSAASRAGAEKASNRKTKRFSRKGTNAQRIDLFSSRLCAFA